MAGMGEGGESKKVTFLEPKGGDPLSLSFGSCRVTTVPKFSQGLVSPQLTDDFPPKASLNRRHNVKPT